MSRLVKNQRGGPSASKIGGRKHKNKEKAKSKHYCTLEEVERLYKGTSKPAVLSYDTYLEAIWQGRHASRLLY